MQIGGGEVSLRVKNLEFKNLVQQRTVENLLLEGINATILPESRLTFETVFDTLLLRIGTSL